MKRQAKDVIWIKNQSGSITQNAENRNKVKDLLDSTGTGFCLAKFTQVTLHLGTGTVHSCHHPAPHQVPLAELEKNPAALFNTLHLKKVRSEMLSGEKPKECDYCWRIENNNGQSDRFFKSLDAWALNKHDELVNTDPSENVYPTYLEVDFSNVCNFSCIYCGPEFSSKWTENLKQTGPIKLLEGTNKVQWAQGWQDLDSLQYKNKDFNPYVDAFWKWFPEAYKHLSVYRITGGEPLLSKETFKSMDWLIENPNPELEFNINSNLCAPEKLWQSFIERATILADSKYLKKFTIFTSVDGWGEKAEYMRPGLDFKLFKDRYEQLLNIGNIQCIVMCTFNILSITSIKELFQWQILLRRKYNSDNRLAMLEDETGFTIGHENSYINRKKTNSVHPSIVGIDIPYLRHPAYLDAQLSTPALVNDYLLPAMNFMANNLSWKTWGIHQGFEEHEIEKFHRIVMNRMRFDSVVGAKGTEPKLIIERAKFYDFVNELDRRSGKVFLNVFPEMEDFYNVCKKARDDLNNA